MLILLFIASTASIALVHQTIWLFTKGPLLKTEGLSRAHQKRSMADLRTLGRAIESYAADHGKVPDISDGPVSRLESTLKPAYLMKLPKVDGWANPFHWQHHIEGSSYTLISFGSDGIADPDLTLGQTMSNENDIYYSNGRFIAWPEGTQVR